MSESIWWPDESWWERKILPLGFITLSFRQLGTITLSFLAAYAVSFPFEFPIAGFSFGGRAAVFCAVFGVGYVISSRRVKLIPAELQAFYILRTRGPRRIKKASDLSPRAAQSASPQEMVVEDFKNPIPLIVSDEVKGIEKETRATLFLDDQIRGEDSLSPQKPRYRLIYVPLSTDIGKHTLSVRLDGSAEPAVSVELLVQGRGAEIGESITRVK